MNKLDLRLSSLAHPVDTRSEISTLWQNPAGASLELQHRLLVLIPADLDYSTITRQIWELANATTSTSVRLLSLLVPF